MTPLNTSKNTSVIGGLHGNANLENNPTPKRDLSKFKLCPRSQIYSCPVDRFSKFLFETSQIDCHSATMQTASHSEFLFCVRERGKSLSAYLFSAMATPTDLEDRLLVKTIHHISKTESEFYLLHPLPVFRLESCKSTGKTKIMVFAGWKVSNQIPTPLVLNNIGFSLLPEEEVESTLPPWRDRKIMPSMQGMCRALHKTSEQFLERRNPVTLTSSSNWCFFAMASSTKLFQT
jgi:hypothetical protein